MNNLDFIVVGSGGGGGTISWLLAKAGFRVTLLEQGSDFVKQAESDLGGPASAALDGDGRFNRRLHDEYRFRLERPDPKRRLRGTYNTFRRNDASAAQPLSGGLGGFTGSVLGGGSMLWGTWSFRALPVDFRLRAHFTDLNQHKQLESWGYAVPDWPVRHGDFEPYYNLAEALFATCGDRQAFNRGVTSTAWYKEFSKYPAFGAAGNWEPSFPFQGLPYPKTPVGHFFYDAMERIGLNPLMLANSLVSPEAPPHDTRSAIAAALKTWPEKDLSSFWKQQAAHLWSDRKRDACNMCGYCGEFLCWGHSGPKSGTRVTTLRELADLPNAEIRTDAQAYEILYDNRTRRATGVRFLDVSDRDNPRKESLRAQNVIVSCGAIQSARLLLMSGPPGGLGNRFDQVGRNVCFHLFGLGSTTLLPKKFQGRVHAEYGHTGNITGFDHYFVKDERSEGPKELIGKWCKGGTLASAAKKNPLENADAFVTKPQQKVEDITGVGLLRNLEPYTRNVQLRVTGDDLPMPRNRVDLDPTFVDEYGLPVARITRDFGPHERWMFDLIKGKLSDIFAPYVADGVLKKEDIGFSGGIVDLVGDHQFGTCRMGDDPASSVVDPYCRVHDIPNLFVVDSSFMPTGLGVNPMMTVVANALRVGSWIIQQSGVSRSEI
jgi:choline dehydrogenase-like flavoprotein